MNLRVPVAWRRWCATRGRGAKRRGRAGQQAGDGPRAGHAARAPPAHAARHALRPRTGLPAAGRDAPRAQAPPPPDGSGSAGAAAAAAGGATGRASSSSRASCPATCTSNPTASARRRSRRVGPGGAPGGSWRGAQGTVGTGAVASSRCSRCGGGVAACAMGDAQRMEHAFMLQRGHNVGISDVLLDARGGSSTDGWASRAALRDQGGRRRARGRGGHRQTASSPPLRRCCRRAASSTDRPGSARSGAW